MAETRKAKAKVTTKVAAKPKPVKEEKPKAEKKLAPSTSPLAPEPEKSVAKAGRRSAKAIKETEAKVAKEERKATKTDEKPKQTQKPARSKLERKSRRFLAAAETIDKTKKYPPNEAIELAKKTSTVKFDARVELHMRLNVDPKQADQNIRGTVVLPAGTGVTKRVAVFADTDKLKAAKAAGADIADDDAFLAQLDKEKLDFDILIATPASMPKLAKYARLLGPKGLMPSPKSGTVTNNIADAVKAAKQGMVEYRVDPTGIIHVTIGKVSFEPKKLLENYSAVVDAIKQSKPASVKGNFVASTYLATSMGPSIRIG